MRFITAQLQREPVALEVLGTVKRRTAASGAAARLVTAYVYQGAAPVVNPPVNDLPATLSGYVVPGFDITATPGVWEDASSITGQWKRAGVDIPGATSLVYTPVQADVGQDITYVEAATGPGGSASASSAPALDAIEAYTSDAGHIDIYGALPDALSTDAAGALGGISPGQAVRRMGGLVYGLAGPVLSEEVLANRPIYQVASGRPGVEFDGANDRLVHAGIGLASRLAVGWACEFSVTARRNSTVQPVWGTALTTDVTLYQRVCAVAGSPTTPGASNVRNSIRDNTGAISACVMVSSRAAVGTNWALRLSMCRTTTDQSITEVQPDSGTQTVSVGSTPSQNRFAMGCFATPTSVTGYMNVIVHAVALWDNGSPSALSVAAARALFTLWGMP